MIHRAFKQIVLDEAKSHVFLEEAFEKAMGDLDSLDAEQCHERRR